METQIQYTRQFRKDFAKLPERLQEKVDLWIASVQSYGIAATQQVASYRDEALKGNRKGQRSFRLNRQWRVIYTEDHAQCITLTLLEVTPHDYRTR